MQRRDRVDGHRLREARSRAPARHTDKPVDDPEYEMKAEIQALVDEIRQSLELLRRHL